MHAITLERFNTCVESSDEMMIWVVEGGFILNEERWIRSHLAGVDARAKEAEVDAKIEMFKKAGGNGIITDLLGLFRDADKVSSRAWFGIAYLAELTKFLRKSNKNSAWTLTWNLVDMHLRSAVNSVIALVDALWKRKPGVYKNEADMSIAELQSWAETVLDRALCEMIPASHTA